MRGCLFVLALAASLVIGVTWFAGPPVAAGLVSTALAATGFTAAESTVDVVADPPLALLAGRADGIRIRATDASFAGLAAERLDLTLRDVELLARSARGVDGRLEGVRVGDVGDPLPVERIVLSGRADAAAATVTVAGPVVEGVGAARIESATGLRPDAITLEAPDRLGLVVLGRTLEARLAVSAEGDVLAQIPERAISVRLVDATAMAPFQASAVSVEDGSLVLVGTLDVERLLR